MLSTTTVCHKLLRVYPQVARRFSNLLTRGPYLGTHLRATMPKDPQPGPISALFGVVKPSGPTSMTLINSIKELVSESSLFVDETKQKAGAGKRSRRGKYGKETVKIGQGGTLDPLADGVLGN